MSWGSTSSWLVDSHLLLHGRVLFLDGWLWLLLLFLHFLGWSMGAVYLGEGGGVRAIETGEGRRV